MIKRFKKTISALLAVIGGNYIIVLPNKDFSRVKTFTDIPYEKALQTIHGLAHIERKSMFPTVAGKNYSYTTISELKIAFPDVIVDKDNSLPLSEGLFTYYNRQLKLPNFYYLQMRNQNMKEMAKVKIKILWG